MIWISEQRVVMTKAYSRSDLDRMLADLRVLDQQCVELEELVQQDERNLRADKEELKIALRKQKALAAKVWRIQGKDE